MVAPFCPVPRHQLLRPVGVARGVECTSNQPLRCCMSFVQQMLRIRAAQCVRERRF
jgi:hypothetical protein